MASEYEESADNIEQYFSSSDKADELHDNANSLEGWADELEQALDSEDDEPTIDHQMFVLYNADGSGRVNDEDYEDEVAAQEGIAALLAAGTITDENEVTIEEEDTDEPNEDEIETWLENLRDVATNAVENCPI